MELMRRLLLALLFIGLFFVTSTAHAGELENLVRRADLVFRGKTSAAVFDMRVKTDSYDRTYKIVSWDDSRKKEDKMLIKILGPASWRGHATLKVGDTLKLYNPKTDHVQVVGHSMLGNSWMGSHFSNDDLVKETRLARDYNLSLIEKSKKKAPVGGKATYYRIKMSPKEDAPVAWGKIVYVLFENDEALCPVRADYYRKADDDASVRTIRFTDVKKLGGRYVPADMTVRLKSKPKEFTRIHYRKIKFDIDIPASKFTEQAMRK
jgi:outer membrane lipoprotein-sorting protein